MKYGYSDDLIAVFGCFLVREVKLLFTKRVGMEMWKLLNFF
jgi:hypothetical protein